MKNSFNQESLQRWFMDNYACWGKDCGQNHWDCFHHIMGRDEGRTKAESSILNAAPMNNFKCHLQVHGELMKKPMQMYLLQKTMRWLLKQGYEFNDKEDVLFIEKYKEYYEIN